METIDKIKAFLKVNEYPCGYGYGDGYGYGSGNGDGYGNIKSLNGQPVYIIDETQTIITQVVGQHAKGFILGSDLTMTPCYIAKCGNYFAHGETLRDALEDALSKYEQDLPVEERIANFNSTFSDNDKPVKVSLLYVWHNRLTGSCAMGRQVFAKEHGIDISADSMTVSEFVRLTENSYRGDVIKLLKQSRGL